MKLNHIAIKNGSRIAQYINNWATSKNIPVEELALKPDMDEIAVDGLVVLNQNQDVDREAQEIRSLFDRKLKPIHNIDINGTVSASISNLELWIERNRCKSVMFICTENVVSNPNLERFFLHLR
jgi:hypothetical protein